MRCPTCTGQVIVPQLEPESAPNNNEMQFRCGRCNQPMRITSTTEYCSSCDNQARESLEPPLLPPIPQPQGAKPTNRPTKLETDKGIKCVVQALVKFGLKNIPIIGKVAEAADEIEREISDEKQKQRNNWQDKHNEEIWRLVQENKGAINELTQRLEQRENITSELSETEIRNRVLQALMQDGQILPESGEKQPNQIELVVRPQGKKTILAMDFNRLVEAVTGDKVQSPVINTSNPAHFTPADQQISLKALSTIKKFGIEGNWVGTIHQQVIIERSDLTRETWHIVCHNGADKYMVIPKDERGQWRAHTDKTGSTTHPFKLFSITELQQFGNIPNSESKYSFSEYFVRQQILAGKTTLTGSE